MTTTTFFRALRTLSIPGIAAAAFACMTAAAQPAPHADDLARRVAPCVGCHGNEGRAASDGYYPRIAGKPAGYLYQQLRNFRDGRRRQYPLMTYTVQHLSDAYLQEIATYFAGLQVPYPPPQALDVPASVLDQGRRLAQDGDAARDIPACTACHGAALTGVAPFIPGLLGLPRDYLNTQFGAWRDGARQAVAPDCMAQIAQRLSADDISAVTAWLATRAVRADAMPAAAPERALPLRCGSVPP